MNNKNFKRRILVDLDGVLNNYTKYEENYIPEIKKGAKEFLEHLSKTYSIVIFTPRNLKQTVLWLIKNKIDNYIDDVTSVKIPAEIFIDDRAIGFNGNFDETLNKINSFRVYWK